MSRCDFVFSCLVAEVHVFYSQIAFMVEMLTGAWVGGAMADKRASKNWANLVIAIDPELLGPLDDMRARAKTFVDRIKSLELLPGAREITLPGEGGDRREQEALARATLELEQGIFESLQQIAAGTLPEQSTKL
jgi:LDH2 family malate/lactate/ureidoglycolate dehydrogenase